MRVTKTVREYIEKKVAEKVNIKYEAEKLEAERQNDLVNNFWDELEKELEAIAVERLNKFIEKNSFVERGYRSNISDCYHSTLKIADRHMDSSVHNWHNRARAEIKEKVDDIIVTLELGGNKEDLERMVEAI